VDGGQHAVFGGTPHRKVSPHPAHPTSPRPSWPPPSPPPPAKAAAVAGPASSSARQPGHSAADELNRCLRLGTRGRLSCSWVTGSRYRRPLGLRLLRDRRDSFLEPRLLSRPSTAITAASVMGPARWGTLSCIVKGCPPAAPGGAVMHPNPGGQ
jgi:hypothetical protein